MKNIVLVCTLLLIASCAQDKTPILGETPFQKKLNAEFKDATTSPLHKKDRKAFKGLDFFKFDSAYIVKAAFKRTEKESVFEMKTNTTRTPEYVKYGELYFDLHGRRFLLNIYQNIELIKTEGYEDYLFLPFSDETNGVETYGGGRYIDAAIPEGDSLTIDFNKAYNPYCAYNEKYSCPIVPRQNYLNTRIEAGVKMFKKE